MNTPHLRRQLLPEVYHFDCPVHTDIRGSFAKIFHADALNKLGINFIPAESFLTKSDKGVLRGMHFQVGNAAHEKLVFCARGRVLDVIVDIRPESPYFNKPVSVELNHADPTVLLIGKGYAHGFLALDDESWMLYMTSTIHDPHLDRGVLWSSIHFNWPNLNPIVSARDQNHPPIKLLT